MCVGQSITERCVRDTGVTESSNSPCTDNVLHDVVTVRPRQSSTSLAYMRALYRGGLNTAEIAAKVCNVTEAEVWNSIFGRCARATPSENNPHANPLQQPSLNGEI